MGAVYEAEHTRLPRHFAIKMLYPHVAINKAAVDRFEREALITSELGHPHIVDVIDLNRTPDGALYIVMELLEGEDLDQRLRDVIRLPVPSVSSILEQTASALEAVHKKGIIHRDLKPQNIFLCKREDRQDYVKVVDFGISKVRGSQTMLTATNVVIGSPLYMSPEQARGQTSKVDHRTDVYAMGVILYQMLAGEVPFLGDTPDAVLYQVVHEEPPPLSELDLDIPSSVEDVVLTALAKDPDDRYSTMAELAESFSYATERTVIDNIPADLFSDTDPAPGPPNREMSFSNVRTDPVVINPLAGARLADSEDITPRQIDPSKIVVGQMEPGLEDLETLPAEGIGWPVQKEGELDTLKEHASVAPPGEVAAQQGQFVQSLDQPQAGPPPAAAPLPAAAAPGPMLPQPAPQPMAPQPLPVPDPAARPRPRQPPDAVKSTFLISATELAVQRKNRMLLVSLVVVLAVGIVFGALGIHQYLGSMDSGRSTSRTTGNDADTESSGEQSGEGDDDDEEETSSGSSASVDSAATSSKAADARAARKEPASATTSSTPGKKTKTTAVAATKKSGAGKRAADTSSSGSRSSGSSDTSPTSVKAAKKRRRIQVVTVPPGARVYVGRRFIGKTPIKGKAVSTSKLDLRITRWGHRSRTENVPAGKGDLKLRYKLEPSARPRGMGILRIAAAVKGMPVHALVFLDGRRKGETPLLLKVPSGRHKVEVWRGKASRQTKVVYVPVNKEKVIIFRLKKK